MGYTDNRKWADRFIPAMKRIVGPRLLVEAPLELDRKQVTDLIVFAARDIRISCRVRKPGYWNGPEGSYPNDITFRSKCANGARPELQKVVDGWGDWFLYGHAESLTATDLWQWMIVDLRALRAHWRIDPKRGFVGTYQNKDDGTELTAYNVRVFVGEPTLVIHANIEALKRWPPVPIGLG